MTIAARGAVAIRVTVIAVLAFAFEARTGAAILGGAVGVAGGGVGAVLIQLVDLDGLELQLGGHLLDDGLFEQVGDGADLGEQVDA